MKYEEDGSLIEGSTDSLWKARC